VVNNGSVDLNDVQVRTTKPDYIEVNPGDIVPSGEWRVEGNEIIRDIGTVERGSQPQTVTWSGTIRAADLPAGQTEIRIEATLAADGLYEGAVAIITIN
jgi:hypothetical protein